MEQRVCLFGPPKSGKTELAGKLAERYNLLWFDLENGASTLLKLPVEWQERINLIKIRDSKDYPIAIETMLKVVKGKAVMICEDHSKVDCPICKKTGRTQERVCLDELDASWVVVFDSGTQIAQSALAHITKNQDDTYKCQLDDWGALKLLMEKFLSAIQVAKYNAVFITHEEEVKFEDGRTKIVPVGGSSNSSRNTAKYFDHVVYCNLVNKKHVVGSATDYSTTVLTGSRTDIKLEASKEGGSLLDVFTTWKLPNFGMPNGSSTEQESATVVVASPAVVSQAVVPAQQAEGELSELEKLMQVDVSKLTPSQRSLHNLKLKQIQDKEGVK
jgi:hypothetical protein